MSAKRLLEYMAMVEQKHSYTECWVLLKKMLEAIVAQTEAAEQPLALDLAMPPAKDDTYKIEWLDSETVRLTPSQ